MAALSETPRARHVAAATSASHATHRLETLACCRLREWLPLGSRVVVVVAQPDDELPMCGAMLHMHAQAEGPILVVAVTDGQAGRPGGSRWHASSLEQARRLAGERGMASVVVGRQFARLAVADGTVSAHIDRITGILRAMLRDDDTVVTAWRRDGPPDHEATALACIRACRAVGANLLEAPLFMWDWAVLDDARVPWARLRRLSLSASALQARRQLGLADAVHGEAVAIEWRQQPIWRDSEFYFV